MGLETQVQQHEEKLRQHDRELGRLNDLTLQMQKSMSEGLTRIDESNKFLREQNTRQSEQNAEILKEVLNRNERAEEHEHELKLLSRQNMWKMIFGIGGSAGVVFVFIMELIKFLWRK